MEPAAISPILIAFLGAGLMTVVGYFLARGE
jgi:hypothetical protein